MEPSTFILYTLKDTTIQQAEGLETDFQFSVYLLITTVTDMNSKSK